MTTHKEINGFDRVTDVLFQFSDLRSVNPEILRKAAQRGTAVHNACDSIILDLPMDDIDPDYLSYVDSFKLWAQDKKFLPKPERFFDETLMLTGECDGLYDENGKIVLFDLKTPAKQSPSWILQGSAYDYLAFVKGILIDRLEFIKLDKSGANPIVYRYENLQDHFSEFKIMLEIYRKYFKNKTAKITDF
jgi:hypothetical protein